MHDHDIASWLDAHEDQLRTYLRELIRAGAPDDGSDEPSVAAAIELTCETAAALGLDTERKTVERARLVDHAAFLGDRDGGPVSYVLARHEPPRTGGRSLIFNGHIDVVSAAPIESWSTPPFAAGESNGDIQGRGASDAKGPFAAALFGAACAAEVAQLRGGLSVVAATDEEIGGMSTLASLLDGVTADGVLVGEPTELDLAPACRGFLSFKIDVEGRHAHAGAGFEGVNAIVKAALCVTALDALQHELDRKYPSELYRQLPIGHLVNIGTIRGGEWSRSVPDACTINGSVGVIGDDDADTIRVELERAVAAVASEDEWLAAHPPEVEWLPFSLLPALTGSDHLLVRTAADACERVAGRRPRILPLLGASDLRFYSRYFGIPGTHLGPGSMRRGHGPDEYVEFDQVLTAARIGAATAIDWIGCACERCSS